MGTCAHAMGTLVNNKKTQGHEDTGTYGHVAIGTRGHGDTGDTGIRGLVGYFSFLRGWGTK